MEALRAHSRLDNGDHERVLDELDQLRQENAAFRRECEISRGQLSEIETSLGWLFVSAAARPPLEGRATRDGTWTLLVARGPVRENRRYGWDRRRPAEAGRASGKEDQETPTSWRRAGSEVSRESPRAEPAGGSVSEASLEVSPKRATGRPRTRRGISRFCWSRIPRAAQVRRFVCCGWRRSFRRLPDVECFVVLQQGGELADSFARVAPTLEVERLVAEGTSRHDVPRAIASAFHEFSSRGVAVCNTLAVSDFHAAFAEQHVEVLSWIHELPTFIALLGGQRAIEVIGRASRKIHGAVACRA